MTSPNHSFPCIQMSPGVLDKGDDYGYQLTQKHHFPNVATTKTVAVVDFLPLVSLSFLNLSAQLAIICSTAMSTGSMCSCETYEYLTGWITKYNPGPSTAASGRFPTRVPSQPLPSRIPFLPSHTPNTQLQMQPPMGSVRYLTLKITKKLPLNIYVKW